MFDEPGAGHTDPWRAERAEEVLRIQNELVRVARYAFRDLPPNVRGELTCGVKDAEFALSVWVHHVGPYDVQFGCEQIADAARSMGVHQTAGDVPAEVVHTVVDEAARRVEYREGPSVGAWVIRKLGAIIAGSATAEGWA
jgi:hypothetical protein